MVTDGITPAGNGRLALTFRSSPDRSYTVEATSTLMPAAWNPVDFAVQETDPPGPGPHLANTPTTTLYVDPVLGMSLYRLQVE